MRQKASSIWMIIAALLLTSAPASYSRASEPASLKDINQAPENAPPTAALPAEGASGLNATPTVVTVSIVQISITLAGLAIALLGAYIALANYIDRIRKERFEEGFRQAHEATRSTSFFLPGEQLSDPAVPQGQKSTDLIASARSYIKLLVVDGGSWLPKLHDALEQARDRGVKVTLLLLDPACAMNRYLCEVEKGLTLDAHFNSWVLDPGEQAAHIIKNRELLKDVADIHYYQSYPAWRGMIVDGRDCIYRIVHAPVYGWTVPERRTRVQAMIEHFEKCYFDRARDDGRQS